MYLGSQSEPLVAARQQQEVAPRLVVINNQRQLSRIKLIVSWHLAEATHARLDQILQHKLRKSGLKAYIQSQLSMIHQS